MPFIMKEKGYPVIGEHTSGGSCLVLQRTTADGVDYCMSGYVRLTDSSGGDIDKGIPADIEISRTGPYTFAAAHLILGLQALL